MIWTGFACGYCGSEQIVERRGGTIGLKLVVDGVARVQIGTDKTAAELAIVRLEKELATLNARWEEADKKFRLQNKSNSDLATAVMIGSVLCLLALGGLPEPGKNSERIIGCILMLGASVAGLIWGVKKTVKAQKAHNVKLSEFSRPYRKETERLVEQIAKARGIVNS